jgi:hypothetical protein
MAKHKDSKNRGTRKSSLDSFFPGTAFPYRRIVPLLVTGAVVLLVIGLTSSVIKTPASTPTAVRPTATKAATGTDKCTPDAVRPDVEKVDALMQEFYDSAALASHIPADQLVQVIPGLQEIRRRAQALKVSACLSLLRSYQLSHMNMVINTLLAFMDKSDESVLREGIIQARLLNEEYKKEKARLLGETYVPPATPAFTPTAGTVTVTATLSITK